jgi:hypothetical protein
MSKSGMHLTHQAVARGRATAARNAAIAMKNLHQFSRRQKNAQLQELARSSQRREYYDQLLSLLDTMLKSVSIPLNCQPHKYLNDSHALQLQSNWFDSNGDKRVILRCNTFLPGSGLPGTAILWTGSAIEMVDLEKERFIDLLRKGRVFIYPATLVFPSGDAFAALPAYFEGEDGSFGYWNFPTAGLYKGQPFIVGRGAFGTFGDPKLQSIMVARPLNYSDADRNWMWHGRSSVQSEGKLVLNCDLPLKRDAPRSVQFLLPKIQNTADVAALRCSNFDDRGDPLALYDANPGTRYRIQAYKDTLYLILAPNHRTKSGRLVFAGIGKRAMDGTMVFAGSGPWEDRIISFEIETNYVNSDGRNFFVASANSKFDGKLVVAIAVQKVPSWSKLG